MVALAERLQEPLQAPLPVLGRIRVGLQPGGLARLLGLDALGFGGGGRQLGFGLRRRLALALRRAQRLAQPLAMRLLGPGLCERVAQRGERRLRLAHLGAPHLELVAARGERGDLLLDVIRTRLGAQALVRGLGSLQLREVVLELRPLLFEARDFLPELDLGRDRLAEPAPGLAAPVDQLVQRRVEPTDQRAAVIAAQYLAHLEVECRLQGGARARGDLGQHERLALTDPEQAERARSLGRAAPAPALAHEQRLERLFGRLAVQMPAIGQRELGGRPAEKALFDAVRLIAQLEREGDPRRGAVVARRLQAPHRLGLRAVALEQNRVQRREQGRLAHFVRPDQEVQTVVHAGDADRPIELAELLELERAQSHGALSLRCSTNRRSRARAAISRAGSSGSSAMARSVSAAPRTNPPRAIASRSSADGLR